MNNKMNDKKYSPKQKRKEKGRRKTLYKLKNESKKETTYLLYNERKITLYKQLNRKSSFIFLSMKTT